MSIRAGRLLIRQHPVSSRLGAEPVGEVGWRVVAAIMGMLVVSIAWQSLSQQMQDNRYLKM